MSSVNYVRDEAGVTYIPATQRPDGTWRRPIRVRNGYVPQDEQPLYVSKGRSSEKSPYPPGLSAADFKPVGSSSSVDYFEIGNYVPTPKIPGLSFVSSGEEDKKSSSSKKKKKNKTKEIAQPPPVNNEPKNETSSEGNKTTEPGKRLRNLRKKLKDIEGLEGRISSGELINPDKDQLEKINRKSEVLCEIDELETLIASLSL